MARLPFRTALLFGSTAPADAISVFGSNAAGSPAYSSPPDPTQIQSLNRWQAGWTSPAGAVTGANQPAIEDVMAFDYWASYFINYLQQIGVVEWDSSGDTPYDRYSIVNGASTTADLQLYISIVNNNAQPLTDTNSWLKLGSTITGGAVAAAWVVFDGASGTIKSSFNVTSVTQVSLGVYRVNFTTALSSATPMLSGSSAGLIRPITPGSANFTFDTAGLVGGGFTPQQYSYVSAVFFSP